MGRSQRSRAVIDRCGTMVDQGPLASSGAEATPVGMALLKADAVLCAKCKAEILPGEGRFRSTDLLQSYHPACYERPGGPVWPRRGSTES
jgi:hypothetical protein